MKHEEIMTLNPKIYDALQWFVRILLPALATFYAGLSELWGLPKPVEIVGTIGALTLFLGALLATSSSKYKKELRQFEEGNEPNAGFLSSDSVDPDTGIPSLKLTLTKLPDELLDKDTVTLHVTRPVTPNHE